MTPTTLQALYAAPCMYHADWGAAGRGVTMLTGVQWGRGMGVGSHRKGEGITRTTTAHPPDGTDLAARVPGGFSEGAEVRNKAPNTRL